MKKDSKDKCNPKEDEALYNNTDNKRFLFLVAPSSVTKSYFGLSLSFYVKAIAMIYAFRAFTTVRQFYSTQQNHSTTDLVFNYICIITAILQYISIYTHNYLISYSVYLVYLCHFVTKAVLSAHVIYVKLKAKRMMFNTFFGVSLGLTFGTLINLLSTWVLFSFAVYCYNYNRTPKVKQH